MSIKHIWATSMRNLTIQIRAYPIDFFIGMVSNCVYSILGAFFIYFILFKGSTSPEFARYTNTSDYMSFAILGNLTYLFVVRTMLNVSRSLVTEMREGTLDCLLISPITPVSYLMGNMLLQTITTTIETIIALLICIPFGLDLSNINILATVICIIISYIAFFGMSIILGGIMIYLKDTYVTQNTCFFIISFICGIAFPVQYLPKLLQFISYSIPITYSLKILRSSVLLGTSALSQLNDLLVFLLVSLIYCIIGLIFINKVVKAAPSRQFI